MSQSDGHIEEREEDNDLSSLCSALLHVLDVVEMGQERAYVSNSILFDKLLDAYASKLNASNLLMPISCAADYCGVHLGQIYEENDFKQMIRMFHNNNNNNNSNGGCLDAFYALKIINDAQKVLTHMTNVNECDATQQVFHFFSILIASIRKTNI